ncbi:MAG: hypothetical protein WC858_03405 [Parcubacteria group bacterium]|jgi:hypothetical protein
MKKEKIYKTIIFKIFLSVACLLFSFSWANSQLEPLSENSIYKISSKTLNANLYKKDGNYEVRGLEITTGEFAYQTDYKNWKGNSANGRVVSFKNTVLGYFVVNYNLSPIYCSDFADEEGEMSGGCEELPEGKIIVQMPYFPNGKYADIFDSYGKKVLTIDLSSKATCNENDQCERPVEDSENCPQDCKNQEPKLDPVVVEKASAAQNDSQKLSGKSASWIIITVFGIILFVGGLGFWFWRRYRKYKEQTY